MSLKTYTQNPGWAVNLTEMLLRVVAGLIFFQSGATKIFGWLGGIPPDGGIASAGTQVYVGGLLELVGGPLILMGFLTRPVAFLLSGMMAVAYWQFHAPAGAWPTQNGGVAAVLYCFLFLYWAAAGAGAWSLDNWFKSKSVPAHPAPHAEPI